MSLVIKFYNYTAEPNRLNKLSYLTEEREITGTLRSDVNVSDPVVRIESSNTYIRHNYMYIPDLGRYYYITKSIYRNNMWEITGHVDVLMSFRSQIADCSGLVARNQSLYDTMLIDDRLRFLGYKSINTIRFNGSVKRGESFILAVNGE